MLLIYLIFYVFILLNSPIFCFVNLRLLRQYKNIKKNNRIIFRINNYLQIFITIKFNKVCIPINYISSLLRLTDDYEYINL